jgi:hypothetical protein
MRRKIEWILALCGAAVCSIDTAVYWKYLPDPGTQHWPFSAFPLIEMVALGWIGAVGIAMDSGKGSNVWGALPWVVTGCLSPLIILGALSIGPWLILAGGFFIGAGVLANRRRQRELLPDVTFFSVGAVGNFIVLMTLAKAFGAI